MKTGAQEILAERLRVIAENRTPEYDAEMHDNGDLVRAAIHVLSRNVSGGVTIPLPNFTLPGDKSYMRNLVVAGQFIAAEIDRVKAKSIPKRGDSVVFGELYGFATHDTKTDTVDLDDINISTNTRAKESDDILFPGILHSVLNGRYVEGLLISKPTGYELVPTGRIFNNCQRIDECVSFQ